MPQNNELKTARARTLLKAGNDATLGKGIPDVDLLGFFKFLPVLLLGPLLTSAIGYVVAMYIYRNGDTALYDKNIERLAESQQGWTLLSAVVFNLVVNWVNSYPMLYKSMIMRFSSGNLRANMQIYKQYGTDAANGYVLLETSGPVGSYNRANRSLTHLVENSIPLALLILLSGGVFPFPTFVLTCIFGSGRVLHQVGYATIGYGAHGPGFAAASTATFVLQMLCFLAADKSLELGMHDVAAGWTDVAVATINPYLNSTLKMEL